MVQKPIKNLNVDVDNIIILKLIETKNNSKYLIGYLDDVIWALVFILLKMSGCFRTVKDKDRG